MSRLGLPGASRRGSFFMQPNLERVTLNRAHVRRVDSPRLRAKPTCGPSNPLPPPNQGMRPRPGPGGRTIHPASLLTIH